MDELEDAGGLWPVHVMFHELTKHVPERAISEIQLRKEQSESFLCHQDFVKKSLCSGEGDAENQTARIKGSKRETPTCLEESRYNLAQVPTISKLIADGYDVGLDQPQFGI